VPDGLDVSGGTSAVSTEDLDCAADQLRRLATEAGAMSAELARLEVPSSHGVFYGDQARVDIELATARLAEIAHRAEMLQVVLRTAAQGYVVSERIVSAGVRGLQESAAQWVGSRVPGWLVTSGLVVSMAGGLWAGIRAAGGLGGVLGTPFDKDGVPRASPFLREHNYLINNATTVSAIRAIAQATGPFVLGTMGMPAGTSPLLGARSFELGAKAIVAQGRSLGLFDETPVRLVETRSLPVIGPPQDYVDRLARIPYFEHESGPQVMIEKYSVSGEPDRFSVYVGGTVTFSPAATTEPWDMTSNMLNATGAESGSVASVRAAMLAAGVDEGSPVQFTGYSQGGGTAARLAASGIYNTQGLTTFGGPTGQVPLPDAFPVVIVEHSDDPVPALGGEQDNTSAVLVRRDVFGGTNLPHTYGVPSHHIEYYLQTARLMDESGSPQLDATLEKLDQFTAGATLGSSTTYRFERSD